ncbi:MAG: prolipoprotein diacylglyceryl transferase [Calditrichaceae bacterium]|nr:prolipoprotein diacylglyceryl transferase [Calditrichia bacterium]NUQ40223.1 prolipoprotein diacylglyceryl transferase [Calditrichaceae bacterium]
MRPRIIHFLTDLFDSHYVNYFVPTASIIYITALSAVAWLFIHRCKSSGLPKNVARGAILVGILAAIVGARLFYLLQHFDNTLQHPELILRFSGGTASWGAYLGGVTAFLLYLRKAKTHRLNYLDVLGSVFGIGPFIGRWACFLNGCCYGTPTNLPWGIQFPQNSFAYNAHLREGLINSADTLSLSVHPVQIYGSILAIIIFFITSYFWKKYSKFPGLTFLFYWLIYGVLRFFNEFFRGDVPRYTDLHLTHSQIIIIFIISGACLGITYLFKVKRNGLNRTYNFKR